MSRRLKKQAQVESYVRAAFTFSQNTAAGWKLSTALAAAGITKKARVLITVNPGVYVGGMILDSAPAKSKITIVNNGNIVGVSGSGTALTISVTTSITNNGMIAGGGGNGGNGGNGNHGGLDLNRACSYGDVAGGSGGRGAGMSGTNFVTATNGTSGAAASDSAARGGQGGNGGGLGIAGTAGGAGIKGNSWQGGTLVDSDGQARYYPACGPYNSGIYATGSPGGAAGKAIQGIAFVTYDVKGNIVGPVA